MALFGGHHRVSALWSDAEATGNFATASATAEQAFGLYQQIRDPQGHRLGFDGESCRCSQVVILTR